MFQVPRVGRAIAAFGYSVVIAVGALVAVSAADLLLGAWLVSAPTEPTSAELVPPVIDRRMASLRTPVGVSAPMTIVTQGAMTPTTDDWAQKLLDPSFWSKNKAGNKGVASKGQPDPLKLLLGGPIAPVANPPFSIGRGDEGTFRTVCVRLCDGAFFPISFATTRDHFDADAAKCEKTCSGGRLFTYANPGGNLDDMEDVGGNAYKRLSTAFLFRTSYNEQCKCRAHPWEETARDQHRIYALAAQRARGDKAAAVEVVALSAKLKKADEDATADTKRANAALRKQLTDASRGKDYKTRTAEKRTNTIKANASSNSTRAVAR